MHAYSYIGMSISVMLAAVTAWQAPTLEGRIVRLEPLRPEHAAGLWEASRDPQTWTWLSIAQPGTRDEFDRYVAAAVAAARSGTEIPLVTIGHKGTIGSTRFLALRPEDRSVEIGWTWLRQDAWGSGANVEAKLLMLDHAFATWGCRRVEFKTDALNERSRRALVALGAAFEGVHRKHMLVRGGESRDSAWYAITDDAWPAVRKQLAQRLTMRR